MTRVTSLDGRVFDIAEETLRGREIARERVTNLQDRDDLPDAPPVGDLPPRELPPHLMQKWMVEGIDLPVPQEAMGLVRARAFPDGRIVIDIDVSRLAGGGMPGPMGPYGPTTAPGPTGSPRDLGGGSCGPTACGPDACG